MLIFAVPALNTIDQPQSFSRLHADPTVKKMRFSPQGHARAAQWQRAHRAPLHPRGELQRRGVIDECAIEQHHGVPTQRSTKKMASSRLYSYGDALQSAARHTDAGIDISF